jgi:hypothetical protein
VRGRECARESPQGSPRGSVCEGGSPRGRESARESPHREGERPWREGVRKREPTGELGGEVGTKKMKMKKKLTASRTQGEAQERRGGKIARRKREESEKRE